MTKLQVFLGQSQFVPVALLSDWVSTPFHSQKCPSLDDEFYVSPSQNVISIRVAVREVTEPPTLSFPGEQGESLLFMLFKIEESMCWGL